MRKKQSAAGSEDFVNLFMVFSPLSSGSGKTENPGPIAIIDPGFPYISEIAGMILCPRGQANFIQAGLLTPGSLAPRAFPSALLKRDRQWHSAGFVPGYSGGPVFDFHEVPFST